MTRRFGLGAMVLALQLLACEGGRHDRTLLGPEMAVAGASGCYTVKVTHTLTSTGVPRQFAGDITGDLQGVAQIGFTEINAFTGVTNTSSGNATWVITGGIIPELIGSVFVTRFDNRNLLLPNTQIAKNLGTHRVVSGVGRANLSYTGETSLDTGVTRLDHHGVICPAA